LVFFRFAPFGATILKPLFILMMLAVTAWVLAQLFAWNIYTVSILSAVLLAGYALVIWRFGLEPQDTAALRGILAQLRNRM
jgi:hypothetical protein